MHGNRKYKRQRLASSLFVTLQYFSLNMTQINPQCWTIHITLYLEFLNISENIYFKINMFRSFFLYCCPTYFHSYFIIIYNWIVKIWGCDITIIIFVYCPRKFAVKYLYNMFYLGKFIRNVLSKNKFKNENK